MGNVRKLRPKSSIGWKEKMHKLWMRKQLVKIQGSDCALCGKPMNLIEGDPREMTIDHKVPLSKGGLDVLGNAQLACYECNHKRGNADLEERTPC